MIRPSCYNRLAEGWTVPSPDEIAEFLQMHGLSDYRAAALIGVGRMTIGRWRRGLESVPYPYWVALVSEVARNEKL